MTSTENLGAIALPTDVQLIPALLRYAEQAFQLAGLSPRESGKLQLALEEAVSNTIKYSFAPEEDGTVNVSFVKRLDGLEVHVHDMGLPYDPGQSPTYDPSKPLEQDLEGIGSYLISQMVDEYQFNNLGLKGKEVVLVKYFDTPRVAEGLPEAQPEAPAPPPKGDVEPIHFSIRRMRPEEALEVCRCIYDCYGYTYANENVYYPDRVIAMNQEGKLLSVVAVTDDGEVGGHFAVIYHDHLPPEAGMAVTKKKFRGQGFARQLGEELSREARESWLRGLQVKQVTAHPYTQKFCSKLGYLDCGLLLAHSPKTLSFKGIADSLKQRNSDVLGFKYLCEPEPIAIYTPARHREMIASLFANLGVDVRCKDVGRPEPVHDRTAMNVNVNAVRSLAEIGIVECGPEALQVLRQEMRKLFLDEISVIELYLSLDSEMAMSLVPEMEAMGFIFTGILPETAYGNALIMQYFNGVHLDLDGVVVVSETAGRLLQYVRENNDML